MVKLALLAVGVGVVIHERADSIMDLQVLPATATAIAKYLSNMFSSVHRMKVDMAQHT